MTALKWEEIEKRMEDRMSLDEERGCTPADPNPRDQVRKGFFPDWRTSPEDFAPDHHELFYLVAVFCVQLCR